MGIVSRSQPTVEALYATVDSMRLTPAVEDVIATTVTTSTVKTTRKAAVRAERKFFINLQAAQEASGSCLASFEDFARKKGGISLSFLHLFFSSSG
jgi:hypothetical protein